MKTQGLVILVVGLLLRAPALGGDAAAEELKRLTGTWRVVSLEVAGKPLPGEAAGRLKVVIKGGQLTLEEKGKPATSMGMQIDPAQRPKALDLLIARGEEKVRWKCIYALEGDRLKICMPLAPKKGQKGTAEGYGVRKRPESFDAAGKPFMVIEAERDKE
jgi:uncharacterized protein (TIGR03067 family)